MSQCDQPPATSHPGHHGQPILSALDSGSDVTRINSRLLTGRHQLTSSGAAPAPQHSAVVLTQWCNEIRVRIRDNQKSEVRT